MSACKVCGKQSPYTCPKCGSLYCCLACYRAHSPQCVASFHEKALSAALSGEAVSDDVRERTEAMLQRQLLEHREEMEDLQEEEDLLTALALADREDFDPSMLPLHIRQQFESDAGGLL